MKKPSPRPRQRVRAPQMSLAFPTKGPLDPKERSDILALLSRLLLQVATSQRESEVADERP